MVLQFLHVYTDVCDRNTPFSASHPPPVYVLKNTPSPVEVEGITQVIVLEKCEEEQEEKKNVKEEGGKRKD
jgi:hypothetical protein